MKKIYNKYAGVIILTIFFFCGCKGESNNTERKEVSVEENIAWDTLTHAYAAQMMHMPVKCIFQEYPNKTGHTAADEKDALKTPAQLHPSFYGCFDWHSSVHGHWMLVRILNKFPAIDTNDVVKQMLIKSLSADKILQEVAYFNENVLGAIFERTYGWAWLLKLDQELAIAGDSALQQLHANLQPLTIKIVSLWKNYLVKQSYPNKSGVHGNTAFALSLALDWAEHTRDTIFAAQIKQKAIAFYSKMDNYPAHLEPDGADFFSPSLYTADLMSRIYNTGEFNKWFEKFFTAQGIDNICKVPVVSDRNDYQIVHLDGLMFSKVANLRSIIPKLQNEITKQKLNNAQHALLNTAMQHLQASDYGGEHWLASFAVLALSNY